MAVKQTPSTSCASSNLYPIEFRDKPDCKSLIVIETALGAIPRPLLDLLMPDKFLIGGDFSRSTGTVTYLSAKILKSDAPLKKKLAIIWYELAERLATLLTNSNVPFDKPRFKADFVRFFMGNPVHNQSNMIFFKEVKEARELNYERLVEMFKKSREPKLRRPSIIVTPNDYYIPYRQFGRYKELATQFVQQGLHWKFPANFYLDASLLHSKQQEDIRSSHQFWLRLYSNDVNRLINAPLQELLGERIGARVFMGERITYLREPKAVSRIATPLLIGADIDCRLTYKLYAGISAHTGLPLTMRTDSLLRYDLPPKPHWEASLRIYREHPNFFFGIGTSPNLMDPPNRFYGAQVVIVI